jgi:hypothetical protein
MVDRPDLLDRSLVVELGQIADEQRRTAEEVRRELAEAGPSLLGALLDVVATGLRRWPDVEMDHLPRMADFVKWVEACAAGLGWPPGAFAEAYRGLRAHTDGRALDLWDVTPCLLGVLAQQQGRQFEGTVAELLKKLNGMADVLEVPRYRSCDWPGNAKALGTQLRRYAPNLRRRGVEVEWLRRSNVGYPVRITGRPAEGQSEGVNVAAGE